MPGGTDASGMDAQPVLLLLVAAVLGLLGTLVRHAPETRPVAARRTRAR